SLADAVFTRDLGDGLAVKVTATTTDTPYRENILSVQADITQGGETIGSYIGDLRPALILGDIAVHHDRVVIQSGHGGKGIGARALAAIEDAAAELGVRWAVMDAVTTTHQDVPFVGALVWAKTGSYD